MVFLNTPGSGDIVTLNENPARRSRRGERRRRALRLPARESAHLDGAIAEIEAAGGKLMSRGEHAPGIRYAYVADPDGYVIEL